MIAKAMIGRHGQKDTARNPGSLHLRHVKINELGNLLVPRKDVLPGEEPWYSIELGTRLLPPTPIAAAQCVKNDHRVFGSIALVADLRLARSSNKEVHRSIGTLVGVCLKFWEFLRLQHIYSLEDVTQDHFDELAQKLARGGWKEVLELERRFGELSASKLVDSRWICTDKGGFSLTEAVRSDLWTNASPSELSHVRQALAERSGHTIPIRTRKPLTVDTIKHALQCINDLAQIDPTFSIPFEPYPDYSVIAKALGRPGGRTKNLEISTAAGLLAESAQWVLNRSQALIAMLEHIRAVQPSLPKRRAPRAEALHKVVSGYRESGLLDSFPPDLRALPPHMMVNEAVRALLIACFILIATLNARRKDEVIHRKFGITRASMTIVSEASHVYQCNFYIEKTVADYVPFYVNKLTYEAWGVMCKLDELFNTFDPREHGGLFSYLFLSTTGYAGPRRWLNLASHSASLDAFLLRSSPTGNAQKLAAHSLRRIYALIFYYCFEDATLQALQFQLVHLDLTTTRQYVVDALITDTQDRIPTALSERHRELREAWVEDLSRELEQVEREKFEATVAAILEGEGFAGGFGRLVLKYSAKLSAIADYSALASTERARAISKSMRDRGHRLEPFRQGDCLAGQGRASRAGRCHSKILDRLEKARATPLTCTGCAYHHASIGHQRSLELLRNGLLEEARRTPSGSIQAESVQRRIQDVERALEVRAMRFGSL